MQAPSSLPDYILSCSPHCAIVVSISRFIQDTGVELCRGLMQIGKILQTGRNTISLYLLYFYGGCKIKKGQTTYRVVLWILQGSSTCSLIWAQRQESVRASAPSERSLQPQVLHMQLGWRLPGWATQHQGNHGFQVFISSLHINSCAREHARLPLKKKISGNGDRPMEWPGLTRNGEEQHAVREERWLQWPVAASLEQCDVILRGEADTRS